jgi:hypothetical protein
MDPPHIIFLPNQIDLHALSPRASSRQSHTTHIVV